MCKCGGYIAFLGIIGRAQWFYCVNCGEQSSTVTGRFARFEAVD